VFDEEVAARVRRLRDRIRDEAPQTEWRRLTTRRFAARLGLTEEALRLRIQTKNPTPFRAEELAAICREFGVRSDYLLLGREPMFESEVVAHAGAEATLADSVHRHMTGLLADAMDNETGWVVSHLPDAPALLTAIETGIADSLDAIVEAHISDRLLAHRAVRDAVATRVRAAATVEDVPDAFFSDAVTGLGNGSVRAPKSRDNRQP
jgi:hypothetical protein